MASPVIFHQSCMTCYQKTLIHATLPFFSLSFAKNLRFRLRQILTSPLFFFFFGRLNFLIERDDLIVRAYGTRSAFGKLQISSNVRPFRKSRTSIRSFASVPWVSGIHTLYIYTTRIIYSTFTRRFSRFAAFSLFQVYNGRAAPA